MSQSTTSSIAIVRCRPIIRCPPISWAATVIALDGVDAIVKHYVRLLSRERADRTDQCPRCASRNVRTFFDIAIALDGGYFEACRECGWDIQPRYSEDEKEAVDKSEMAEASHDGGLSHSYPEGPAPRSAEG